MGAQSKAGQMALARTQARSAPGRARPAPGRALCDASKRTSILGTCLAAIKRTRSKRACAHPRSGTTLKPGQTA